MDVRALAERAGIDPGDIFTIVTRGDTIVLIDRAGRKHAVPASRHEEDRSIDGQHARERPRRRRPRKEE
ncbi:MAG: hypothetical protein RMJ05_07980 [Thermomicrobium sp.]|nr:hypothetical protein [Thermomicrobium sp.]MDW8006646.1 hypothetical protein [Thermomicrobium sp.]